MQDCRQQADTASLINSFPRRQQEMKILFTGVYPHLYGGLERFAERAKAALEAEGHQVDTAGDPPTDASSYDFVLMQKIPPTVDDLIRLKAQCGDKLHFYAHDHETYCLRRHYYDPFKRNCDRMYSFFPCRFCAAVTRPQWIFRALTRDIRGFQRELRTVNAFAPANYIRQKLIDTGFPPDNVRTVYPLFGDFQPEQHNWMPNGCLRILFMGQLIAGKGVKVLLEALQYMKHPAVLNIVGTGRDELRLKRLASQLPAHDGVRPSVTFWGWQENAQRFFSDCDVCCVPSLWNEPFGTVGAEALSHGIPVVTFDVGGLSDWLEPGKTGFFPKAPDGTTRCAAARNPASLAEALDACASPEKLAFMSECALDKAQKLFGKQNFLRNLLQ